MSEVTELTPKQYLNLAYEDATNDGEVTFVCTSCKQVITNFDGLGTPCHTKDGFVEPSGHGGLSGMHIYCVPNDLEVTCNWGGPVTEYEPQLVCVLCLKVPFAH